MVFLQPEQGAGNEEVFHLVAAKVVDQGRPVQVLPQARVLVFIQGRAIEVGEAVGVFGEVGRNPVEDDADTVAVAVIDEPAEVN